jgi:pyrimidine deaminase RibD-like protein
VSKRDNAWLQYAIRLAHTSQATKRHGCVIVKGGSVMGRGVNRYVNNPFKVSPEHMHKCSIHAEVAAIRDAGGSVRGATIYVARINNRGEPRFSAPCEKCKRELNNHGIKRAVWTVEA